MTLYTASLNSGSNGNCYYIGNGREAVLIDAGISCLETEKRLHRLGLSMQLVKAVFISHEHTDHIRGIERISRKYGLPVYITPKTLQQSALSLDDALVKTFNAGEPVIFDHLSVTAFTKAHDAADPHSFMVEGHQVKIGVFTDIGVSCDNLLQHFKQCHAAFLEANYDSDMLENGRYPYHLKKRIRGGLGHLSNAQAFALFKDHKPEGMSHLFLSHLSKENNTPELVYELFQGHAAGTRIVIASRDKETDLYAIEKDPAPAYMNIIVRHGQLAMSL